MNDVRGDSLYDAMHKERLKVKALQEKNRRLREAAKAYRELNVCYRIGQGPSVDLLKRVGKAGEALADKEES